MKKITQTLLVPLAFTFIVSCTGSKPVAMVGDKKITKNDVELRLSMMKVFNPQMNEKAAVEQLIRSETLLQILKNKGIEVKDQMVEMEMTKLKGTSKNNPKLEALMKDYGSKKKFKDLYIVPTLVEGLAFREAFQKDTVFHKEENEKMEKLLAAVKSNPSKLEESAKQMGVSLKKGVIKDKEGLTWDSSDRDVAHMPVLPSGVGFGQFFKKMVLEKTPTGKVSEKVETIGQLMAVVRNDSSSKDSSKFTVAMVARKNFGDWFNQNSQSIKVNRLEEANANAQKSPMPATKTN
ncbi:MAG: hypothetical protein EBQ92_06340 [Proteobacteria bacterium]|nr:hypothetical protein [Pseudomonadota bacterium]